LRACRIDLASGYVMTAIFGVAMIIVGSTIVMQGSGTTLLVDLSSRLEQELGPAFKWLFLIGTWGTVFSSLLGVWQAVPYLFADCWRLKSQPRGKVARGAIDTTGIHYRAYLLLIALVPIIGIFYSFREVQKIYTVTGALLFPVLAVALLVFNGRAAWVGKEFRNGPAAVVALLVVLAFFGFVGTAS
jgi:hypothetical protein